MAPIKTNNPYASYFDFFSKTGKDAVTPEPPPVPPIAGLTATGGVISDYERERISERMNFGKLELIKSGGKLGNIGLGFKRVGKRIEIDKESANLVKEIFKIYNYKNVSSYGDVYKRINKLNKKKGIEFKLSSSTIGRILKDKKYNGLYEGSVKINDEIKEYRIELD